MSDGKHPEATATRRGVPIGLFGLAMGVYAMMNHNDIMIYVGAGLIALATKMVSFKQLSALVPWSKRAPPEGDSDS